MPHAASTRGMAQQSQTKQESSEHKHTVRGLERRDIHPLFAEQADNAVDGLRPVRTFRRVFGRCVGECASLLYAVADRQLRAWYSSGRETISGQATPNTCLASLGGGGGAMVGNCANGSSFKLRLVTLFLARANLPYTSSCNTLRCGVTPCIVNRVYA
eukprot:9028760-Pyramimonas_sp.AAC.1